MDNGCRSSPRQYRLRTVVVATVLFEPFRNHLATKWNGSSFFDANTYRESSPYFGSVPGCSVVKWPVHRFELKAPKRTIYVLKKVGRKSLGVASLYLSTHRSVYGTTNYAVIHTQIRQSSTQMYRELYGTFAYVRFRNFLK